MKEKFFGMVGFIFDAIKVIAALVVVFFAVAIVMAFYRVGAA
jgi:preprotein translocase subunit SecG